MRQISSPDGGQDLLILFADLEVAGYFDQGRWVPVRFGEYVRLSKQTESLAFLQPRKGFAGIDWHLNAGPDGQDIAVPLVSPEHIPMMVIGCGRV